LAEEDTTALVRACRSRRLTLGSALNAAMLVAVHRLLYDDKPTLLRHFNFADLRLVLKPRVAAETLGSYHGMLRVTVPMPSGTGLWATASVVNEKISSAARRGDSLWSVKLSTAMMRPILRQQKQRMGTTALSYTGPSRLPRRFGSIEVSSPDVFISNLTLGPEYTAQARLADGELHWNIVYLDCDMDRAMADRPTAEDIQKLVGRQLGLRDVRLEDDIAADLGAVSADIINIVAALEDLYNVVIGEEELPDIRTVEQLQRLVCERVEAR
jgi:acyl carrier protein